MDTPYLQVTGAAAATELMTLAALKAVLGITGSGDDAELELVRDRVSAAICSYCNLSPDQTGAITFGRETMTATWLTSGEWRGGRLLLPWRIPVVSITSVVEDGTTLAGTDYRVLPMQATLERLDGDYPGCWSCGKIVVTYVAGYLLPDETGSTIPADLQDAALHEATARWRARGRDPTLRSENLPDVYQQSWAASGGALTMDGGVLPETAARLARWRRIPV